MKVAIDTGALKSGHKIRGIGVMVDQLIKFLKKDSKKDKGVKIDAVDFEKADLCKYDIVHYPYFFPYVESLPSEKLGRKEIVTIQDIIHLIYPGKYPSGLRGKVNFYKQKMRLKQVDGIITISETSKKDIVRFLRIEAKKIKVIYLAPKKIFKQIKKNSKNLQEVQKRLHG